jgi:hypothetical protein
VSERLPRASRQAPSRAAFARGLVAVLAVFVALAGVIRLADHGHHRPEGYAESWLSAVSDMTRKGVHDEAARRANRLSPSPLGLAERLLRQAGDTGGKRALSDLEVGKAHPAQSAFRVPFRLHIYRKTGTEPVVVGTLKMSRPETGEGWTVENILARAPGEKVPSEGGPPPSRAPLGLWVGALVVGLVITALASLAVRVAGRAGLAGRAGRAPAPAP